MEDGSVVIWNVLTNSNPFRDMREQTNSIWDVSFSPDGNFLASIDLQGDLVIWSTEVLKIYFKISSKHFIYFNFEAELENSISINSILSCIKTNIDVGRRQRRQDIYS